jgi:GT2 family glycosyltransferase
MPDALRRDIDADLTVVIPTLGRDIIRRCLEALEHGTVWPGQVIVVDQGRRPEIEALLGQVKARSFDTCWVPSSEQGRAAGVNRGIERATTRFVAVTDDDCLVHTEWVSRLGAMLRQNPDTIITGSVEAQNETVAFVVTDPTPAAQYRPSLRFDRLIGANMALERRLMAHLGGLDEDSCLRTAEDGEFAYRALRAGVPIIYCPDLMITHLAWRDDQQRLEQYENYARSQGGFYGKYLRRGDLFIAVRAGIHLIRALRRWGLSVVRRKPDMARVGRAYVTGLLPGIRAGWRSQAGG